jgi:hypothetical protein
MHACVYMNKRGKERSEEERGEKERKKNVSLE